MPRARVPHDAPVYDLWEDVGSAELPLGVVDGALADVRRLHITTQNTAHHFVT